MSGAPVRPGHHATSALFAKSPGNLQWAASAWWRVQSDANLSLPALQGDFAKMQGDATWLLANQRLFATA